MKRTSLRKNRLFALPLQSPGNISPRKFSEKQRRPSTDDSDGGISLRDMMMKQWAFNDDDIAERLAASVGRRISPEVQAYYDRMFALTQGNASEGSQAPAALSDAA